MEETPLICPRCGETVPAYLPMIPYYTVEEISMISAIPTINIGTILVEYREQLAEYNPPVYSRDASPVRLLTVQEVQTIVRIYFSSESC